MIILGVGQAIIWRACFSARPPPLAVAIPRSVRRYVHTYVPISCWREDLVSRRRLPCKKRAGPHHTLLHSAQAVDVCDLRQHRHVEPEADSSHAARASAACRNARSVGAAAAKVGSSSIVRLRGDGHLDRHDHHAVGMGQLRAADRNKNRAGRRGGAGQGGGELGGREKTALRAVPESLGGAGGSGFPSPSEAPGPSSPLSPPLEVIYRDQHFV